MTTLPPESRPFTDPRTGARVRQVTDHPSIHHHPFYYLPCMDDAMTRLFVVSHRTGHSQVYEVEVEARRDEEPVRKPLLPLAAREDARPPVENTGLSRKYGRASILASRFSDVPYRVRMW